MEVSQPLTHPSFIMKHHINARRSVPSGRVAHSARVLPTRACFAHGCRHCLPVRGSALPGRNARHCSPPTAEVNHKMNICQLIERPPVHAIAVGNHEPENCIKTLATGMLLAHQDNRLAAISRILADAVIALTHSLNSVLCFFRSCAPLVPSSVATVHPSPFLFAFSAAFLASSEGCPNLSHAAVLSGVVVPLLGTLAAVPGCVKILGILFSASVAPAFIRFPLPRRGRSLCCANGESAQWHTADRISRQTSCQRLNNRKR